MQCPALLRAHNRLRLQPPKEAGAVCPLPPSSEAVGRGRSHCPPPCIFKIYRLSNDFHQFINFYSGNSIAII